MADGENFPKPSHESSQSRQSVLQQQNKFLQDQLSKFPPTAGGAVPSTNRPPIPGLPSMATTTTGPTLSGPSASFHSYHGRTGSEDASSSTTPTGSSILGGGAADFFAAKKASFMNKVLPGLKPKKALEDEIEQLKQQLEVEQSERAVIEDQQRALHDNLKHLHNAYSTTKAENQVLVEQNTEMKAQVERFQGEWATMKEALGAAQAELQKCRADLSARENEVTALRREIELSNELRDKMQQINDSAEASSSTIHKLLQEIQSLTIQVTSLNGELATEKKQNEDTRAGLETQLSSLKESNGLLTQEKGQLSHSLDEAQEEIKNLQSQIVAVQQSIRDVDLDRTTLQEMNKKNCDQIAALQVELEQTQQTLVEKVAESSSRQSRVHDLEEDSTRLMLKYESVEKEREKLVRSEAEAHRQLAQVLRQYDEDRKHFLDAQDHLKSQSSAMADVVAKLTALQGASHESTRALNLESEKRTHFERRAQELETQNAALTIEVQTLRVKIDALTQHNEQTKAEALAKEKECNGQLALLEAARADLAECIASTTVERMLVGLERDEARALVASLQQDCEQARDRIAALEQDVTRLESTIRDMKRQFEIDSRKQAHLIKDLQSQLGNDRGPGRGPSTAATRSEQRRSNPSPTNHHGASAEGGELGSSSQSFHARVLSAGGESPNATATSLGMSNSLSPRRASAVSATSDVSERSAAQPASTHPHQTSSHQTVVTDEIEKLLSRVTKLQQTNWEYEERIKELETTVSRMRDSLMRKDDVASHWLDLRRNSGDGSNSSPIVAESAVGTLLSAWSKAPKITNANIAKLQKLVEETTRLHLDAQTEIERLAKELQTVKTQKDQLRQALYAVTGEHH